MATFVICGLSDVSVFPNVMSIKVHLYFNLDLQRIQRSIMIDSLHHNIDDEIISATLTFATARAQAPIRPIEELT